MANKPRPPTALSPKPPFKDGDGNHIHNTILLGLPPKECGSGSGRQRGLCRCPADCGPSERPHGNRTFMNRGWLEYTGLSPQEVSEPGWEKTIHPDDLNRHTERWRASIRLANRWIMKRGCAADRTESIAGS
jgi:PAS domain-containing protein